MNKRKRQTSEPDELSFMLATANLLAEISKQDREAIAGMTQGLRHIHHIRGQIAPEYVRPLVENIEQLSPEKLEEVIPLLQKGDPPTLMRLSNQSVKQGDEEHLVAEADAAEWLAALKRQEKFISSINEKGLAHLTIAWRSDDILEFADRCGVMSASLAEVASAARALVSRRRRQDSKRTL